MDLLVQVQAHKHQQELIQYFQQLHQQVVVLEEIILHAHKIMVVQVDLVVEVVVNLVLLVDLEMLLLLALPKEQMEEMMEDLELQDLEKVELVEVVLRAQDQFLLTKLRDQVV